MFEGLPFGLKGFHPTSMVDHFARAFEARPNDLSVAMKYTCLLGSFVKASLTIKNFFLFKIIYNSKFLFCLFSKCLKQPVV